LTAYELRRAADRRGIRRRAWRILDVTALIDAAGNSFARRAGRR
jgi:hypothetical protein